MKKKKGISKLTLLMIIAIIIIAVVYWLKYFSEPMTTVITGGSVQSLPIIDKAKKARDTMDRTTQATDEAARKASEGAGE